MGDWYLRPDPDTGQEVWRYDPAAPSAGHDPAVTMIQPIVPRELDALHGDEQDGDIGDLIDPNADDPTPEEITHPDHSDYVEPWRPEPVYETWYRSIGAEPA
jgi:hypothetical protein